MLPSLADKTDPLELTETKTRFELTQGPDNREDSGRLPVSVVQLEPRSLLSKI
jgi:hypothetical protein